MDKCKPLVHGEFAAMRAARDAEVRRCTLTLSNPSLNRLELSA